MSFKHYIPWIGRIYRQRDLARIERAQALGERDRSVEALRDLPKSLMDKIPDYAPFPDWGKEAFLKSLTERSRILDVGCGNNSPFETKRILPYCYYVGLDIGDYNQTTPNLADEYHLTSSMGFCGEIVKRRGLFDAVISAHNLEHCEERNGVLEAMAQALKIGGKAYISFPCSDSVLMPNRSGSLNYYDDPSHNFAPPDFCNVVDLLSKNGCRVNYASTRYQPPIRWITGLFNEPDSTTRQESKE